jgi:hypothetical protein
MDLNRYQNRPFSQMGPPLIPEDPKRLSKIEEQKKELGKVKKLKQFFENKIKELTDGNKKPLPQWHRS